MNKKMLHFLASLALVSTAATSVIACGTPARSIDNRVDLSQTITNIEWGKFAEQPTESDILSKLKAVDPNFDESQIKISDITNTSAIIKVIDNSKVYKPFEMKINYTTDERQQLNEENIDIDFKQFDNQPSATEILNQLKQMNLELDESQFVVSNITNKSATISVKNNSTVYKPFEMKVNYTTDERQQLNLVVTNTKWDKFAEQPTVTDILTKLKATNPHIDESQLVVSEITNTSATIKVIDDSKIYKPFEMKVSYTVDERSKVNEVITNIVWGEFYDQPTAADILTKFKETNPKVDTTQLVVSEITNASATMKVINNSTVYKPFEFKVIYTVDERPRLQDIIKITDLGEFLAYPSNDDLVKRIQKLNPEFKHPEEIHFLHKDQIHVVMNVIVGSKYYKESQLTIDYDINWMGH